VPVQQDVVAPQCPICGAIVTKNLRDVATGAVSPDAAIDAHLNSGACTGPSSSATDGQPEGGKNTAACSMRGCKQREVLPLVCKGCDTVYCVKHRHGDSHACPALRDPRQRAAAAAEARAGKREDVASRFGDALSAIKDQFQRKGAGSSPTAERVAQMRLRTTSKAASRATVNEADRFFLAIDYSMAKPAAKTARSLYFHRDWKVGKVLDLACDVLGVVNRNNEPAARKLFLVSLRTGEPLETSVSLADYHENNIIRSGDTVALAYAD
jgi:hypothetical protein